MLAHETISFAQWLKQHRKELDLTQEDLAERIGCSYVTVHKMEAGSRRPSRQIAELLADLFKVPDGEREAFINFARGLVGGGKPPDPASPHRPPGNLPARLTHLVGREGVAAEL